VTLGIGFKLNLHRALR